MPNVSRRSFINLAAGLVTRLPIIAGGGLVLAPREALAEDDATLASQLAGKESEYVVIGVVAPWQVCFHVVDITNGTTNDAGMAKYPSVRGAHVTVTSRFNGKTAEGTTDENGFAYVDVRELAVREAGEDVNNLDSYEFNGSVAITCEKYRDFRTAEVVVTGGEGLQVPAHSLDSSDPYAHLVSFDEWDALYWCNDFVVSSKNADEHTINVELYNLSNSRAVTVGLWVKGEGKARQSVNASVNGSVGTASFKGHFLQEGHADHIPVGASLELVVTQQGHNPWRIPLAVTFSQAVVEEPAGKDGQKLSLINTLKGGSTGVGATWDSGVPIIGGGELKFWAPELPVNVYVNPFGLAQLTLTIPIWGYRNDKGDEEPSGWGRYPRKTVQQQWDKKVSTLKKMTDKTAGLVSKPGAVQQIDLFKSFSIDINFQLLALAQWDASKGLFQGEVAGQILAALNFTITENFMAGPIPVLITFSLDASLVFGLSAATYATKKDKNESMLAAMLDFSRWSFDYENTGFTMTFNLTPALSVGVGIRGVASISIKGAITLTLFFGVPMGTQPKELPSPHFSAGWSAQISLVIELFLFTMNFKLYTKPFENFYDNWDGKNLTAQAAGESMRAAAADLTIGELLAGMVPITNAMLEKTKEGSLSGGLTAQSSEDEFPAADDSAPTIDWDALAEEDVLEFDDGTTVPVIVYDLTKVWGTSGEDAAQQDGSDAATSAQDGQGADAQAGDAAQESVPVEAQESLQETTQAETDESAQDDATDGVAALATEAAELGLVAETPAAVGEGDAAVPASEESQPAGEPVSSDAAGSQDAATQPQDADAATPDSQQSDDATALSAQSDGEDTAATETRAPAEGALLTAMASSLPTPDVKSLGVAGGVRPSSDIKVIDNEGRHVFAASHAKTVDLGRGDRTQREGVWIFRLASIDVGGNKMRTRVVANCISGGPQGSSRIIDFDTVPSGFSRAELYDYDFQVLSYRDNYGRGNDAEEVDTLHIAILSGRRESDGSASFANASTDLVFSYMLIRADELLNAGEVAKPSSRHCLSWKGTELATNDPGSHHSINSFTLWPLDQGSWTQTFALSFLDRYAPRAEDVLSESAQVRVGVRTIIRNTWKDEFTQVQRYSEDWLKNRIGDIDSTAYEMVMYPNVKLDYNNSMLFMLRGAKQAHYFWMTPGYNSLGAALNSAGKCKDYDPAIRLVECPAQGYFLASYPNDPAQLALAEDKRDYSTWSVHKVTWQTTGGNYPSMFNGSEMVAEPVGPAGFNVVNFAVNPKGTFLFWPQSRDADEDRVWDANGKEDVKERPAVYQIMASRIRGSRFSDPFVVADLPNDTDALSVVATNSAAVVEALRTEYVDTGERDAKGNPVYHSANLWYTAVPAVRCVTATACEAPYPFVNPGGKISFHVAVRNDGNTYLSGCTLELCMHNDERDAYERVPGASAFVTFGRDTIQESTYNRSDGRGGLTNLEDDYALAPGKTSVYSVTVTVPSDWPTGKDKKVLFVASGGQVVTGLYAQALHAQAEGDYDPDASAVEFHVEPGEYNVVQARTQPDQPSTQRHMDTIDVEVGDLGGELFLGKTAEEAASEGGTGARRAGTPNTADPAPSGMLGAGIAAAGAAVLAYERRRAQNER